MKNSYKTPPSMTGKLAEEIGWHLGDGSMNYYRGRGFYQLRGHLVEDQEHYQKRIKSFYKDLFGVDVSLREMPSCGVYGFQLWSDELVNYKSKVLRLPLGKKIDFSIPSIILENKELSIHFLRGYFDTDGCVYLEKKKTGLYPRIEMASVCKKFLTQIKEVLLNLGFRLSFYKENRRHHGWKDLYRIIIRGHEMTDKWFKIVQPANPKHQMKYRKLKGYGPAETFKRLAHKVTNASERI